MNLLVWSLPLAFFTVISVYNFTQSLSIWAGVYLPNDRIKSGIQRCKCFVLHLTVFWFCFVVFWLGFFLCVWGQVLIVPKIKEFWSKCVLFSPSSPWHMDFGSCTFCLFFFPNAFFSHSWTYIYVYVYKYACVYLMYFWLWPNTVPG